MKYLSALLLFVALFYSTSAFTQKNKLTFGTFYLPTSNHGGAFASLEYYQSLKGRHSIGVKTSLNTDAFEVPKNQIREYIVRTDLVHRWSSRFSQWHLDAGFSLRSRIERIPKNPHYVIECEVGVSPEKIMANHEYYSVSHTIVTFHPGIATAVSYEYPVSRQFGLGVGFIADLYFTSKENSELFTMPSVNASYRF